MRQSYWPDRARKSLVGPAWPWMSPLDGDSFALRVRNALEPYWTKRLQRFPADYLSAPSREYLIEVRQKIPLDARLGCGFEKLAAAVNGEPDAFWFFELGSAAWIMSLVRMRAEGWLSDDETLPLGIVESEWRKGGAARAVEVLRPALAERPAARPLLSLYMVPLALWHAGDVEEALLALDRAVARLSLPVISALGSTLPLTYALLFALKGDVERAASILEEGRNEGRTPGMRGFDTAEVYYQRARYLWDLRRFDEARTLLRKLLGKDPAYLVRLLTDPAWSELHRPQLPSLHQLIGEVLGDAQSQLARFQQSRRDQDLANPVVRKIDETLGFVGDDPYMLLAAASLLPDVRNWQDQQQLIDPAFETELQRLEEFAEELPTSFPLRIGGDYAPRFTGEGSDMERLQQLVEQERYMDAADLLTRLYDDLPWALRMGTATHLTRLTQALATAGDVLRMRGKEEDGPRLKKIVELLERCIRCLEPVKAMPDKIGPHLIEVTRGIWRELEAIETAWVQSERRQFGQMRIEPPSDIKPIRRGSWAAIQVRVTDVAGQPVAGVPVLWRVASGPAFPKNPAECLEGEWGLSLHTGTVHITVEVMGRGDGGTIEAWILGNYSPVTLSYRVTDE